MDLDFSKSLLLFSKNKRLFVLVILLLSAITIYVVPQYFKSVSPETEELKKTISFQQGQIDTLNTNLVLQNQKLVELSREIISNQQECTNRIVEREKEIMSIIDEMKSSLKYRQEKLVLQDSVMLEYTPRVINEDKSYKTLCDLEKKIKKKN